VRTTAVYSGLAGEIAALLHASTSSGRDAVAVLPDPQIATRAQELLTAFPTPNSPTTSGRTATGPRHAARIGVDHRDPVPMGLAGLAVVLAGPVRPGATTPPRYPAGDHVLARATRGLAPGAPLVLLCPPQATPGQTSPDQAVTGDRRQWLIDTATGAGLRYTQHLVLVHVPVADTTFTTPDIPLSAVGPFHPIHTDAFVFTAPTHSRSCP
jgi:hypothetical protein